MLAYFCGLNFTPPLHSSFFTQRPVGELIDERLLLSSHIWYSTRRGNNTRILSPPPYVLELVAVESFPFWLVIDTLYSHSGTLERKQKVVPLLHCSRSNNCTYQ